MGEKRKSLRATSAERGIRRGRKIAGKVLKVTKKLCKSFQNFAINIVLTSLIYGKIIRIQKLGSREGDQKSEVKKKRKKKNLPYYAYYPKSNS